LEELFIIEGCVEHLRVVLVMESHETACPVGVWL
jgi:hypothetical protein